MSTSHSFQYMNTKYHNSTVRTTLVSNHPRSTLALTFSPKQGPLTTTFHRATKYSVPSLTKESGTCPIPTYVLPVHTLPLLELLTVIPPLNMLIILHFTLLQHLCPSLYFLNNLPLFYMILINGFFTMIL